MVCVQQGGLHHCWKSEVINYYHLHNLRCVGWEILRRKQPAHCSRVELIQFNLCYSLIHSLAMENEVSFESSSSPCDNTNTSMLFFLANSTEVACSQLLSEECCNFPKQCRNKPWDFLLISDSNHKSAPIGLSFARSAKVAQGCYLLWHKTMGIYYLFWDKRKETHWKCPRNRCQNYKNSIWL